MIVDAIIGFLVGIIDAVLALLPNWFVSDFLYNTPRDPEQVGHPLSNNVVNQNPLWYIVETAAQLNAFLPIDHAFVILAITVFVWGLLMAYKIARIVIGTVRGSGTS